MPAGRAGRGSGRRHRGAGPGRHVRARGRGALRMRAARPGCRPSSDGARRRCCASASPTFAPSRPACRSRSTRRSPRQPPSSQPSTAGASTTEEPNERSIVRPQPCSRRPPSTGAAPPRKGLLLRLDPAMHRRLRLLAVQEDTTVQQLGVEALEMLLQSTGRLGGGHRTTGLRSSKPNIIPAYPD